MILPNVVIVGAPKCGTSTLFSWLTDHPEVCGSSIKETFYLMDREHPKAKKGATVHDRGLEGYSSYFNHCQRQHTIVLEATTHYMYQQTALDVLSTLPTKPQIIFMLRKPSERVFSSFTYTQQNLANLDKSISFSQFVEGIRNKANGSLSRHFTSAVSEYVLLNDIQYSQYIDYISRWLERFGHNRIHVFLLEAMRSDKRAFMYQVAGKLGIDPVFYRTYEFTRKNETFAVKNQALHRNVRQLSSFMPKGLLKNLVKRVYLRIQSGGDVAITAEDRVTLAALERHFQPFNQRLALELNLNLAIWDAEQSH